MRLPKMGELYNPIIDLVCKYNTISLSNIRFHMEDYFFLNEDLLTDEELRAFIGRVNNVCSNMTKDGILNRISVGMYSLSDLGKNIKNRKITVSGRINEEFIENIDKQEINYERKITLLNLATSIIHDSRVNNMLESGKVTISEGDLVFAISDRDELSNLSELPLWVSSDCRFFYTEISTKKLNTFRSETDIVNAKKILKFRTAIANANSFNEVFRLLIDEYKLSTIKISDLTGISESMIKRFRLESITDRKGKVLSEEEIVYGKDETKISIQDLSSLFVMLRIPPSLFDDCLDVALCRTSKEATARYKTIIDIMYGEEIREIGLTYVMRVNKLCKDLSVEEIFPEKVLEEGYWDNIKFIN